MPMSIVEVGALELGAMEFEHVTSRIIWDGAHVKLADTKGHHAAAAVNVVVDVDLSGSVPAYHAAGDVAGFNWKEGKVDADLSLDTFGSGLETIANLRAEGSFKARNVDPDYPFHAEGCFQFAWGE